MDKVFLEKGVQSCRIVIPRNADIVEKTAAEELSKYIELSLSVSLPTVSEDKADGKCIYIGRTEYAKVNGFVGKSPENWIIAMRGGNLVLTGGEYRGVIYAVYHFIEDFLGVRWWNPYEEDILSLESLSLSDDLYREGTPCFHYRKPYLISGCGVEGFPYLARTRTNSISPLDENIPDSVYDETVRKYGGARWAGRPHHVHTMGKYFPRDEYFDKHPEWFAWNKRYNKHIENGSYCFSNEAFFNALSDKLLAIIKEDVLLAEKTGVELPCYYSLSINDVDETLFCQCPECEKTIEEAGFGGYALKFVNRVAREVAKVYPWVKVEFLAYQNFIEAPKDGTLPEKNVIIQLAEGLNDMGRSIYAPTNKYYLRLLKEWSAVCRKAGSELYIYDYLYNIRTNYPLPIFYRLKETVMAFKEYGVGGIFVEAQSSNSDFWEINRFVLTHLLEDPEADADALIDDAINRYYGKAGGFIKEYALLLREGLSRNIIKILCCREDSRFNYIDLDTVIKGTEILQKAEREVSGISPFEHRVSWLRKTLDAVIAFNFFDFKRVAEARGEKFDFDIKEVKARIIAALSGHLETPMGKRMTGSVAAEQEFFENIPEEECVFNIPNELSGIPTEDIYQFTLYHMPRHVQKYMMKADGYSEVEDCDSSAKKVMKISFDTATGNYKTYTLAPTSKNAEVKSPLIFKAQRDKEESLTKLFKEDLVQGGYHLYKVGSVSEIGSATNVRLALPGGLMEITLGGIAVNFPMDACDVYVSMKCTGEVYGGKPGDENAIYFERMIIVRN
ncbi:MAG: DUF4838 domain-containing protein [Oscillospiraceae bacterium]|nr:DUF4838 domain-containing protein [Oscillospiraceae bacterium]